MKRPSGGASIGPWVVGGLVGLCLLGGVIVYADLKNGNRLEKFAPKSIRRGVVVFYHPVIKKLEKIGILP